MSALPRDLLPRRFYRAAHRRLEEADVLFDAGYNSGCIHLAGYAVECMLKALILQSVNKSMHVQVEAEFRGERAHNLEWLRQRYSMTGAPSLPAKIVESLI